MEFLVSYNCSPSPFLDDKNPCHLPEASGPCRGLVTRYFFNSRSQQCQHFFYGGCFGNANNFRSMAECQAKCQNPGRPGWTFVLLPFTDTQVVRTAVWIVFCSCGCFKDADVWRKIDYIHYGTFPAFTSKQDAWCNLHTSGFIDSQGTSDHSCCTTTIKIVPAQKMNFLMDFSWAWNHIPPWFSISIILKWPKHAQPR